MLAILFCYFTHLWHMHGPMIWVYTLYICVLSIFYIFNSFSDFSIFSWVFICTGIWLCTYLNSDFISARILNELKVYMGPILECVLEPTHQGNVSSCQLTVFTLQIKFIWLHDEPQLSLEILCMYLEGRFERPKRFTTETLSNLKSWIHFLFR